MLWICDENRIDNTGMFVVIAEWCLSSAKAFSASHPPLPGGRLGMGKKLGLDSTGTAD